MAREVCQLIKEQLRLIDYCSRQIVEHMSVTEEALGVERLVFRWTVVVEN